MRLPRDNPSATLLGDGDILIVGGNAAAKEDHYTVGLVEIFH
jgi:hypothetical protein